jgi:RND family efflux transporter MFP subunit
MKLSTIHPRGAASPLVFIGLAAVVLLLSWWGINALSNAETASDPAAAAPAGMPPANVILSKVEKKLSQQTQRVIGTLRAKSRSKLAAREAGAVLEVLVKEGDLVKMGATIAKIDPRRLEAQVVEAKAAVTEARAVVTQREAEKTRASSDLKMKEQLFAQRALSESEVLDARRGLHVADALASAAAESLGVMEARVDLIKVRREDLEILAPFAGRVVASHTEIGEWVIPGSPVVTLLSVGEIEAWLQVPERFASVDGSKNIPVKLTATGKMVMATKLIPIPDADRSSRTVQMIAMLPDPDNELVPGLSVSAELPVTDEIEQLMVPVNAVVQSYSGPGVFVPQKSPDSPLPVAKRIEVEVLYKTDGYVFIRSKDLKEGDQVIVEGNERLFPFQPLMVQEAAKK